MATTKLTLNSVLTEGKDKGRKVSDIIATDKKRIFALLREGKQFDDEVLAAAGIKKTVRDTKVTQVICEHAKDNKVYQKDTMRVDRIIGELSTIRNPFIPNEKVLEAEENRLSSSFDFPEPEAEENEV